MRISDWSSDVCSSDLASTALAQDAGGEQSSINEIIVTAQKRSERQSDVPLSITAVQGDRLFELGVSGPQDLEKVALGFTFRPSAQGSPIFQIRSEEHTSELQSLMRISYAVF